MTDSIQVSAVIPATPAQVYTAWLDGVAHTRMTGGAATVEAVPGGRHTAWDGYIEGRIVALEPARRIVTTWRTTDFPDDAPDSTLEILLVSVQGGTRISLVHAGIPAGQGEQYRSGWQDHYFQPMIAWFVAQRPAPPRTAAASPKRAAKKASAKKASAKKASAKKASAKKASAKKASAKKEPSAKKASAKKASAKKASAKKASAKKASAKKASAKKASAKKASAKKASAKKRRRREEGEREEGEREEGEREEGEREEGEREEGEREEGEREEGEREEGEREEGEREARWEALTWYELLGRASAGRGGGRSVRHVSGVRSRRADTAGDVHARTSVCS